MNALRLLVEQIMTDEGRLFDVRAASTKRNNALLLGLTLAGLVLIVLIGTFSIFLVQRTSRQREAARNELEATNANLERIVAHRTADLAEANEEIQRFAYIVSHDLRSPLVNIMGFTGELEALRDELFKEVGKLREQSDGRATHAEQAGQNCVPIDPLSRDFDEAIGFIKTSTTKMDRLINAA
jgi:signal transduction histidine kinase